MTAAIEINNLGYSYGETAILEDISLQIDKGEFFGIIGPNAAGKSTLLKLILGLFEPVYGSITVLGDSPEKSRTKIGYVSQYPTFQREFPINVHDVVTMGRLGVATSFGGYSSFDRDKAMTAMQVVQIEDIANQQIGTLSGGQTQRMLIARALACEPEILILDEPTASIDMQAEENLFGMLKEFNEHMTIIVVSHDIGFISGYVRRVGCLNKTLICHSTQDISGKTIEELYGTSVKMIHHAH